MSMFLLLFLLFGAHISQSNANAEECVLIVLNEELAKDLNYTDATYNRSLTYLHGLEIEGLKTLCLVESQTSALEKVTVHITQSYFESTGNIAGCTCGNIAAIIGAIDVNTASILHNLANRSNLNFTLVAALTPSISLPVTDLSTLPNVLDMNPLSHYIQATASFVKEQNWIRIGLISGRSSLYHYVAESLAGEIRGTSKVILSSNLQACGGSSNILVLLDELQEYNVHFAVLLMDKALACCFLEEIRTRGLNWPDYVWAVLNVEVSQSYLDTNSCLLSYEGVFVIEHGVPVSCSRSLEKTSFGKSQEHFNASDLLFKTLHDSIRAASIDECPRCQNISFCGETGLVTFRNGRRLRNTSFYFISNHSAEEVAHYDASLEELFVGHGLAINARNDSSTILNRGSTTHIVLVAMTFVLSIGFLIAVFALYAYFRNEPEIKASSFSVSLCIFLGSFCLLINTVLVLVEAQPASDVSVPASAVCILLSWLSPLGLPFALIVSALLVKMLRVYAIFSDPFSYQKKYCTDLFLFIYIVFLVSPTFLILLLWTAIDPLTNREIVLFTKSHNVILEECSSSYIVTWVVLLLSYLIVILIILSVVAFKTSKIRYKNFKDTKATNAFGFLTIFCVTNIVFYWLFFDNLEESVQNFKAAEICLYVGHFITALLCPIFLFVPKIYPPLKRCFDKEIREISAQSTDHNLH